MIRQNIDSKKKKKIEVFDIPPDDHIANGYGSILR